MKHLYSSVKKDSIVNSFEQLDTEWAITTLAMRDTETNLVRHFIIASHHNR